MRRVHRWPTSGHAGWSRDELNQMVGMLRQGVGLRRTGTKFGISGERVRQLLVHLETAEEIPVKRHRSSGYRMHIMLRDGSLAEKWLANVAMVGGGGCWEWLGGKAYPDGYGQVWDQGKRKSAHRATWELFHGEVPGGLVVRHACDNKRCVRPDHLLLGTQMENMMDAVTRGQMTKAFYGVPDSGVSRWPVHDLVAMAETANAYPDGVGRAARRYGVTPERVRQLLKPWKISRAV